MQVAHESVAVVLLPLHTLTISIPQSNNMEAIITMAVFNFQQDSSSIQIVYWTTIKRNGENIANGESVSAEK